MLRWFRRKKKGWYDGPVVFSEGSHYPARNGQLDTFQRLLWVSGDEKYRWATDKDPTHQHLYEVGVIDIPVNPMLVREE